MKKVVIGMSGGVDSSATAYILKKEGYEVIGVTFSFFDDDTSQNINDAAYVASTLGIKHYVADYRELFTTKIKDYFIKEYKNGKTPNPCVKCNEEMKWFSLLEEMKHNNADYIATGHYAAIIKNKNGRYAIKNADNKQKDQTYALYRLTQEQLSHALLPLYKYTKEEVRQIAKDAGLILFDKPDSQEICFIPDGDYVNFLQKNGVHSKEGFFVLEDGTKLCKHKGIIHYTVGQRKGLGISYKHPLYVKKIDVTNNEVIVCENNNLFKKRLVAENIAFMYDDSREKTSAIGKIRYNHSGSECNIHFNDNKLYCEFQEPQRAITKGQSAVFYKDDVILFGGIICDDDFE